MRKSWDRRMTLNNLLGKNLERLSPHPEAIQQLLAAAMRNIADSKITLVSAENRFDAAYKAIMQIANAALPANDDPMFANNFGGK
jgi:hypothetical protein